MIGKGAMAAVFGLAVASAAVGQTTPLWPEGGSHSHGDSSQHVGLGFGLTEIGHLSLGQYIGEVDVRQDPATGKTWVAVALHAGGFALVDGTDPSNPVLASKTSTDGGFGADVKLSDDTQAVFVALQGSDAPCVASAVVPFIPALPEKFNCGVQAWDTTDKYSPRFLWTWITSATGSHMMDYEEFNGVPFIATAAQGTPQDVPIALVPPMAHPPIVLGRAPAGFNHDVTLRADPLDPSRLLAFVANWDLGVRVYDLTVPASPQQLMQWMPPAGSGNHIHTVMPLALEGRRIIIAEQENFGQNVVSKLFFLDATDFGNVTLLGTWQNPDGRQANSGFVRWSTHNFNLADGKLYMGHYHGGVVVLDIDSLADLANPAMLGNFLPSRPRVTGAGDVPSTWDAFPSGNVIWATDINTGLYAIAPVQAPHGS